MNKDILAQLADHYWDWIGGFPPALRMLILRWSGLLVLLLLSGIFVRNLGPRWGVRSLAAQLGAFAVAVLFSFLVPVRWMAMLSKGPRNTWITLALLAWLCLPYFVPRFLVRRQGLQEIVWPGLYATEFVLLVVQIIVCARS